MSVATRFKVAGVSFTSAGASFTFAVASFMVAVVRFDFSLVRFTLGGAYFKIAGTRFLALSSNSWSVRFAVSVISLSSKESERKYINREGRTLILPVSLLPDWAPVLVFFFHFELQSAYLFVLWAACSEQ